MDAAIKGETPISQSNPTTEVSGGDTKIPTPSPWLSITGGDRWFTQLPVVTVRSQFTGHNLFLWTHYIQAILRPQNMIDHLTECSPPSTDPNFKRWIVEEGTLYVWILDSMTTELANQFIEYKTVKDIWAAVYKYHSKKNDQSKIAQLVSRSCALQHGERSVLTYTNELSDIYRELDHYRPLAHNSVEWEYILMD